MITISAKQSQSRPGRRSGRRSGW